MFTKRVAQENKLSFDWSGKDISFATGKLAPQSDGAITITLGENVLLFTAVINKKPDTSKDFLPLMVDFRESFSAAGKIGGGSYKKRETRPSDQAVLNCRLTDRAIRPMFGILSILL